MFDKPICHIKSPYLLPEITQKYLMYGKLCKKFPLLLSEEDALYYKGLVPSYFPQVELYIVKREE